MNITEQLIIEFNLKPFQIENTLALFAEGGTVPFISRYRKEQTGDLDEVQLRDIEHRFTYFKELEERRTTILESIKEQGKLTPELEQKITATLSKTELEDLYLPYKPRRMTRAIKAKEAGLEPLATWLVECAETSCDVVAKASEFVNSEKGFDTPAKALQGGLDILAEVLSDNADVRKWLRELAEAEGEIASMVRKDFVDKKTKFEMYYKFREAVKTLPSHRILALFRGEREKVISVALGLPIERAQNYLETQLIKNPQSATVKHLKATVKDSFERLLLPATETEIRLMLKEIGEAEAFKVFGENLGALLLSAPAGHKAVLGFDPGFRSGCKVAALDSTGKFLEYRAIFPHEPQKDMAGATRDLLDMIAKYNVSLIAIGNGTASRESDDFIRQAIANLPVEQRPIAVVVNESGASVYSASEAAAKEFPDQDVTVRGAISIARRLQDPLAELVKIDPKAIGVGQYQHDVNQTKLQKALEEVVESCVNNVGVDVNLASAELLQYVAGLNRSLATRIVNHRNEKGAFISRESIKKVSGMGEKTFTQAAGFLRIPGAQNPLDNSAVHPERYTVIEQMAKTAQTTINELIGNTALIRSLDKSKFLSDDLGASTLRDILAELEKPGRDPRSTFTYAQFTSNIREIKDLSPGLTLEGTVTNVTNFGAFVDIGVHQDGLVHISELADRFVKDPRDVVHVGQVVKVRVVSVDTELKRIALSMKSQQSVFSPGREVARNVSPIGKNQQNVSAQPRQHTVNDLKNLFSKNQGEKKLVTVKHKINIKDLGRKW